MNKECNRIQWLDIMRGIGIIIMIMGHVGFGGKFDRWIHTYHMPLFFVISGFLYGKKKKSIKQFVFGKCRTLLLPYLSFLIINYLVWLVAVKDEPIFQPLVAAFTDNTHGMPLAGALWFLTALFCSEMITLLFQIIFKNNRIRRCAVFLLAVLFSAFSHNLCFQLPLSLGQGIVGAGFLQIGQFLAEYFNKDRIEKVMSRTPIWWGRSAFILVGMNGTLSFVNGYVNMKEGWYSNWLLFWTNSVIGVIGCFCIAVFISKISNRVSFIFEKIGEESIIYLGLNQLFVFVLLKTGIKSIGNSGVFSISGFIGSMIVTFCTIGILNAIAKWLKQSRYRYFVGK